MVALGHIGINKYLWFSTKNASECFLNLTSPRSSDQPSRPCGSLDSWSWRRGDPEVMGVILGKRRWTGRGKEPVLPVPCALAFGGSWVVRLGASTITVCRLGLDRRKGDFPLMPSSATSPGFHFGSCFCSSQVEWLGVREGTRWLGDFHHPFLGTL